MGAYKYISKTLQGEYKARDDRYRARILTWRREPVIKPLEYPSNLARARRLGYQAKQGYLVVRSRIRKGRRKRPKPRKGRKPRHNYRYVQPGLSHQAITEQRVNRKYPNMEVLNSYWVGEDGEYKFFEIILADQAHAAVQHTAMRRKNRSYRGLTSQGKKARGLGR